MKTILTLVTLFGTGLCQNIADGIIQDLYSMVYGVPLEFENCSNIPSVEPTNINFNLYTQENRQVGTVLTPNNFNMVDPANPVRTIIHGWTQHGGTPEILKMKDTYLDQGPENVIVANWSYYSNDRYSRSFCAVPQVAVFTGDLIYDLLVARQLNPNAVQINGFSLGAHIAGGAGKRFQDKTGGVKIGRIIAMDAAGPGFYGTSTDVRVDAEDATYVLAVHTNNGELGYTFPYATIDFQVNCVLVDTQTTPVNLCGAEQPCCPANQEYPADGIADQALLIAYCSYARALQYVTASITSKEFLAVPCNCEDFGNELCTLCPTTVMGEHCPLNVSGVVYLNTIGVPPYSKGQDGTGGITDLAAPECALA